MKSPPNILWIQTDEQRPDSLGCYGSDWARTPNIDSLAASGVTMLNAFCQAPICSPSRMSQLAGRYPAELNALSNLGADRKPREGVPEVLPPKTVTFPEILARAGYSTTTIGKTHTPRHEQTWQRDTRITIFRNDASYTDLGAAHDPEACRIVQRPGGHPIIIGGSYPEGCKHPTAEVTDQSIAFLEVKGREKPFLLRISYNSPHTPVMPPAPFDQTYDNTDIPVRLFSRAAYETRSRWDRAIADRDRMDMLSAEQQRQAWYDYMSLAAYVDHEVGRVLDSLDRTGLRENTIVLFSSDHGRALGEWGAGEKCMFDDQVWRVPFIWNFPQKIPAASRRDDLCELRDTGRTLLALTGLTENIPKTFGGRDLFSDTPPPNAVFGQIGWPELRTPILTKEELSSYEKSMHGIPVYNSELRLAVRTDRYRLDVGWMANGERIADQDGNLFDLQTDPHETINVWDDENFVDTRTELLGMLQQHYQELKLDPRLLRADKTE
ncbi:MAG: sulfatase-like hydrolase/transferase [Lentisphaeria bacterium]|nr:sulfatase-like hydrolase/transferase [Lentisphaeria bacterium]